MAKDMEEAQKPQDTRGDQKETLKGSQKYALGSGRFTLTDAIYLLRKKKGMKGPKDHFMTNGRRGKIMGHLVSIPESGKDIKFILIGKGSDLHEEKVTIPKDMLFYAVDENLLLIGGLQYPDKEIDFHAFLPIWIFDGNFEELEKFPYLVSFPFSIGERWDLMESLASITTRLRERYDKSLKQATFSRNKKVKTLSSYFDEIDKKNKELHGRKGNGSTQNTK